MSNAYDVENEEPLKPCPFCGGGAKLKYWHGFIVECGGCYCSTGVYSKRGAIDAWNRRVGEKDAGD